MQNKIVRNLASTQVLNLHTNEIYKELNLLNVDQIYAYRTLEFGFRWLNCNDYYMLDAERHNIHFEHNHSTRGQNRIRIPFPRLNKHKEFVLYSFIKLYNRLPNEIAYIENFNKFKKRSLTFVKNNI